MPIKKEFFIRLLTSKNLGAESFAPGFLDAWFSGNPKLVPEKFSHGEPVRHSIEEKGGIPTVLEWWRRGMPMFKRVSAPKQTMIIDWKRERKLNPRPYLGDVSVFFDGKAKDELVKEFFDFLIDQFEPEFAYITTWEDWRTKHYIRRPTFKSDGTYAGMGEGGMGFDFLEGVPGIYWITYMTVEVIPPAILDQLPSGIVKPDSRGYYIQAYPSSSQIGSEEGLNAERQIRQTLGEDRFFDAETWLKAEMAKIK